MQLFKARRTVLKAGTAGFAVSLSPIALWPITARAQANWPSQTLRIIVPFAPGGTSDFIARLISQPLGAALGVQVVVDNKPGASGVLGTALTANATDGHTVMLSDLGTLAINPLVTKDLAYKPSDIRGVAMLGYSPHLLAVNPALPVSTLKDLVELSKKKPINVASAGSGSVNHLGVVEIALATGMKWQHVPYKGGAQAITDTMAGVTDVLLNGMVATQQQVTNGKLKSIAVSKRTRLATQPNLATVAEQGVAGFESGTYQGVVGPVGMPAANVMKLNQALARVMQLPEVKAKMNEAGAEVLQQSPEEVTGFLKNEQNRWEGVIKKAGNQIEGNG